MVGHVYLLQISLRDVASRFSSNTNCRTCSYFQMLISTVGGFYMIRSILPESFPILCEIY